MKVSMAHPSSIMATGAERAVACELPLKEGEIAHPGLLWYAIRVRSNFERPVLAALTGKGLESFLPTYRKRSRWSDRLKEIDVPLFPGYTFCRLDASNRLPVLITPGVVSIVGTSAGPVPIEEREIEAVRTIVRLGSGVGPWPFLHEGQFVAVERGPLAGVEGVVVAVKGQYRLVVSISLLQRSVAVEIDRGWVRPMGSNRN